MRDERMQAARTTGEREVERFVSLIGLRHAARLRSLARVGVSSPQGDMLASCQANQGGEPVYKELLLMGGGRSLYSFSAAVSAVAGSNCGFSMTLRWEASS